jgi:hypothetical protein
MDEYLEMAALSDSLPKNSGIELGEIECFYVFFSLE